jgi:hypothetical protein
MEHTLLPYASGRYEGASFEITSSLDRFSSCSRAEMLVSVTQQRRRVRRVRGMRASEPLLPPAGRPPGENDRDLVSDLYQAHALALVRMAKLLVGEFGQGTGAAGRFTWAGSTPPPGRSPTWPPIATGIDQFAGEAVLAW